MKYFFSLTILFSILQWSGCYYAEIELEIYGIFPTDRVDVNSTCTASWNYYLETLLITPTEMYHMSDVMINPNSLTDAQKFYQNFTNTKFISVFFYPKINCTIKNVPTSILYPPSLYCDPSSQDIVSFPLDLSQTSTLNQVNVTICNNTIISYSYTYNCLFTNYYPPSCAQYCNDTQSGDICYTCNHTGSGAKICCSGYDGDDCSKQVTTSQAVQSTCASHNDDNTNLESEKNTYFIAMIVVSCIAGILLLVLIILLIWFFCTKNKSKQQTQNLTQYRGGTKITEQRRPEPIREVERREPTPVTRRLKQPTAYIAPSIHSDSSDEVNYFDRPWNINIPDNQGHTNVVAEYSNPQKKKNPPRNHAVSQRYSDQSQTSRYQDPNSIFVLEGDDNEEPEYGSSRRNINGTFI